MSCVCTAARCDGTASIPDASCELGCAGERSDDHSLRLPAHKYHESARQRVGRCEVPESDSGTGGNRRSDTRHRGARRGARKSLRAAQGEWLEEGDCAGPPHRRRDGRAGVLGGRSVRRRGKGRIHMGTRRARHEGSGSRPPDGDAGAQALRNHPQSRHRLHWQRGRGAQLDRWPYLRRATSRPVAGRRVSGHRRRREQARCEWSGCLLRRRRSGEENVLAAPDGERHAFPRLASDQAESGPAARGRAGQDRPLRDAAPRYAGSREILPRHRADLHRRAACLAFERDRRARQSPRAELDPERCLLERDSAEHDFADPPDGIEQDQRHSARSVGER